MENGDLTLGSRGSRICKGFFVKYPSRMAFKLNVKHCRSWDTNLVDYWKTLLSERVAQSREKEP